MVIIRRIFQSALITFIPVDQLRPEGAASSSASANRFHRQGIGEEVPDLEDVGLLGFQLLEQCLGPGRSPSAGDGGWRPAFRARQYSGFSPIVSRNSAIASSSLPSRMARFSEVMVSLPVRIVDLQSCAIVSPGRLKSAFCLVQPSQVVHCRGVIGTQFHGPENSCGPRLD